MDWCGRIGEVRELFRSEWLVGYHWVVPKIFSMPDRVGPVYYSPTFKFLNMTWYFGIYRYSSTGNEEWIGFDIRRSATCLPMPARFSVGLMQADKSEYLLHRNQSFPSRDNVCSINEFLLKSNLLKAKDKLAPSDQLTVTCVIWPDVPAPGECKEFWHSEQNINSGGEVHAHKTAERKDAVIKDASVTKDLSLNVETAIKSIAESSKPEGNDSILREISTGDESNVRLQPSKTNRNVLSPEITRRRTKYDVRSHSESALSSKEFCHSAQNRNAGGEAHAHKKAIRRSVSVAEDVLVMEDESHYVETKAKIQEENLERNLIWPEISLLEKGYLNLKFPLQNIKSIAVSNKREGTLREISRGVEWDVRLPPSRTTWDVFSPEFTCGRMKYHFSMFSSELFSNDIYLGFIVHMDNDAILPIRWRMAVKRRDFGGLRWIMNGKMIVHGECHQHAQEICIKRAELECSLSSEARLTFVHYLSVGEVDGEKEVSTQTAKTEISQETQTEDQIGGTASLEDKTEVSQETQVEGANLEDFEEQFMLCLTHPVEGDCLRPIQKKPLNASTEKYLSEIPRDKKHFIFAA